LAVTYSSIGPGLVEKGRLEEALRSYHAARSIQQKLVQDNPDITEFRSDLMITEHSIGRLLGMMGKTADAMAVLRGAREAGQRLAEASPGVTQHQRDLAAIHNAIGGVLGTIGRTDEARASYEAAREIRQRLAETDPKSPDFRRLLLDSFNRLSDLDRFERRPAEACRGYDQALAIAESLALEYPQNSYYRAGLAISLQGRGLARRDLGDSTGAKADLRRALAIWDGLGGRSGEVLFATACCHAALSALAASVRSSISVDDGLTEAEKAVDLLYEAVERGYRNRGFYRVETALDRLRDRSDIRLLMMDLSFPAEPFDSTD
jgi:tetratricopeptide (TPR) repeat protein